MQYRAIPNDDAMGGKKRVSLVFKGIYGMYISEKDKGSIRDYRKCIYLRLLKYHLRGYLISSFRFYLSANMVQHMQILHTKMLINIIRDI